RGRVNPIRELLDIFGARLRNYEFVIADGETHWRIAKRSKLLRDKILPLDALIIGDGRPLGAIFGRGKDVLVKIVGGAKIPEMPIESGVIFVHASGYGRHHDVTAVSGIARDGERPRTA